MKDCKFKVGDKVTMKRKTLYGETEGTVTEVSRYYQALDRNGNFDPTGLIQDERHLSSICLPWRVIEDVLEIDHPHEEFEHFIQKARTHRYKLNGWSVCVKTAKMNTIYDERSLKLKNKS